MNFAYLDHTAPLREYEREQDRLDLFDSAVEEAAFDLKCELREDELKWSAFMSDLYGSEAFAQAIERLVHDIEFNRHYPAGEGTLFVREGLTSEYTRRIGDVIEAEIERRAKAKVGA